MNEKYVRADDVQSVKHKKYLDDSKKRLKTIIEKKMKTTFIGALAAFEKHFAQFIPINKTDAELSNNEKLLLEKWNECRKEVLDNGNHQLKGLLEELENNTISWDRYTVNISIK